MMADHRPKHVGNNILEKCIRVQRWELLIITDSRFAVNVNKEQLLPTVTTALQTQLQAHITTTSRWIRYITDVPLFEPYRQFPAEGSMKRTFKWLRFRV